MPQESQLEHDLADRLLSTLAQMPNVAAVHEKAEKLADYGADAVVTASINGRPVQIMVQCKRSVFPRDVKAAFWDLRSRSNRLKMSSGSIPTIPLIAAETISDGAKELLQTERIGYFETSGSLFLASDDLYLLVDKPAAKAERKVVRPLFSGNRSQVIHALLVNPDRWFSANDLAALAFVSPSTVSVVFRELEKRDLADAQGKGPSKNRRLAQPAVLLDEWAKYSASLQRPKIRRYYVPLLKPEALMQRIDEVCKTYHTAYVISHEWAAQLYSPFLSNISQVKCRIFPNAPLSLIAQELNAREVEEGSNWGLIESESTRDMLFEQNIRGLRVESPVLTYLDLIGGEGRSREMAEHLRQEKIGF
jgi:hypothetical protein